MRYFYSLVEEPQFMGSDSKSMSFMGGSCSPRNSTLEMPRPDLYRIRCCEQEGGVFDGGVGYEWRV